MSNNTLQPKKSRTAQTAIDRLVDGMLEEWKRSMLTFWTLGLLLDRPMYGLEIKKKIETSTQGKMKLGASTIYQLLRRLEGRGLLACRWEPAEKGPPRAYYDLTPAGRTLVYRYASEILSPASPIASALAKLIDEICERN
jgi:PadR family transcriptional regulator PadR